MVVVLTPPLLSAVPGSPGPAAAPLPEGPLCPSGDSCWAGALTAGECTSELVRPLRGLSDSVPELSSRTLPRPAPPLPRPLPRPRADGICGMSAASTVL